jgi:hypothetical protein
LRVVYAGDAVQAKVRLVANSTAPGKEQQGVEVHPLIPKPQPVKPIEFDIPIEATSSGQLTLTWHSDPERGGAGRGCQIAEAWLLKVREN